jgi:hypothetical protein
MNRCHVLIATDRMHIRLMIENDRRIIELYFCQSTYLYNLELLTFFYLSCNFLRFDKFTAQQFVDVFHSMQVVQNLLQVLPKNTINYINIKRKSVIPYVFHPDAYRNFSYKLDH